MEAYIYDWLSLILRWFHVIAGIAWIGASFYFVWLDCSLREPPEWKKAKGIKGDLWAIHGGGFYEVAKYHLGPEELPKELHWFKWEAYATGITGFLLLTVVYYFNATGFMLSPTSLITDPLVSVLAGIGTLAACVIFYELLFRSPLVEKDAVFALAIIVVLSIITWAAFQLFAPRAAFIHMGAGIGTIMVANVFLGIIPSQLNLVNAVKEGREPDETLVLSARKRSLHNNYLTLPVIFIMISNHYPFVYSGEYGWLWLICIGLIAAYARHFFNKKNRGETKPVILIAAAIAMILLAFIMAPRSSLSEARNMENVSDEQAMSIIQLRCAGCHAADPTQAGFNAAPAGVLLETVEQLRREKSRVIQTAVNTRYMPLGNMTGMTEEERQKIAAWLSSGE